MKIRVRGDNSVVYPYERGDFKAEYPNTSEPMDFDGAELGEFGVFSVVAVSKPTSPDERVYYIEGAPVQVNGVWTQVWVEQTQPINEWRADLYCTRYQFRRALRTRNIRDQMETWLATATEAQKDYFLHSRVIKRSAPAIEDLRVALGATHPQVDAVFVDARAIAE